MNHEEVINIMTARSAREKGFDWKSAGCYVNPPKWVLSRYGHIQNYNKFSHSISAPPQSVLQKWLREKHKVYVTVNTEIYTLKHGYEVFVYGEADAQPEIYEYKESSDDWDFETYEAALESGLYLALQLIE